ncbi:hypothetical protein [Mucilaginibacter sp.]|uniref:hypothetical protein n=1 Tax=Mucilaginibacter sp. TaxID=1882438 RepID=UPI002638941A|nr:hypothetical protein [Mucilaginibacter sp.]MDB4920816.1 hypothetical protein [Mucilaginibacter sp.]
MKKRVIVIALLAILCFIYSFKSKPAPFRPQVLLTHVKKFVFKSFVDCNMSEVWVGDKFMIFPGKYGEDPLWGPSRNLKYATGSTIDEAFSTKEKNFTEPRLPPNVPPGKPGLHGAVWFESVYQDVKDQSGKTLYALYHNENYPETLPYDAGTGKGYKNIKWPQGLKGPSSPSAVCRIGVMKSTDGGQSWDNRGIFIEDEQPRLILRPNNTAANFAGGTGDPSAVANGKYLYLFYGEYGYPGVYNENTYKPKDEWKGQCISIARIAIADLDNPAAKAKRWDGKGFTVPYNGVGKPVTAIQIPVAKGGGPASSPTGKYYWGPSVSWNTYLNAWVMLMAKAEGPSWKGSSIYVSFNKNPDLGTGNNSQQWTKPVLLLDKPGHTLWYPSLQPLNEEANSKNKYSSVKMGQKARLFFKDNDGDKNDYISEYLVEFRR